MIAVIERLNAFMNDDDLEILRQASGLRFVDIHLNDRGARLRLQHFCINPAVFRFLPNPAGAGSDLDIQIVQRSKNNNGSAGCISWTPV